MKMPDGSIVLKVYKNGKLDSINVAKPMTYSSTQFGYRFFDYPGTGERIGSVACSAGVGFPLANVTRATCRKPVGSCAETSSSFCAEMLKWMWGFRQRSELHRGGEDR